MALPVIPVVKIIAVLAAAATGIGYQWLKSKDDLNNKDIDSRFPDLVEKRKTET